MTGEEKMSETHDCGGDAAAYVLGALEPDELETFREHLYGCAVCRDEVAALGGVVQTLPRGVYQYAAPRELRARVMHEVRRGAASERLRRPRMATRALLGSLAASAVAAAAVVTGVELSAGVAATVFQARLSGISGSAQLRVSGGHAELVVRHLTPPGRARVYEVWLQSGSAAPVPASVLFSVNAAGYADVGIPDRLRGVTTVMVTAEPLGGTRVPTQAPVITARLD